MAISECHYRILKQLRDDGTLPECKSILNIGQPNWYGDMDPEKLRIADFGLRIEESPIDIARTAYEILLGCRRFISIDIGGDKHAIKADLNLALDSSLLALDSYDLIVNHGTAEHIFNIGQVFRTMHDHCRIGGFMIHESPFTGWIDHGFYSLHPTLFYDLAAANGYAMPFIALEMIAKKTVLRLTAREQIAEIVQHGGPPDGAMLFVVFQKQTDAAFQIPTQGVYAGGVSDEVKAAWRQLR